MHKAADIGNANRQVVAITRLLGINGVVDASCRRPVNCQSLYSLAPITPIFRKLKELCFLLSPLFDAVNY